MKLCLKQIETVQKLHYEVETADIDIINGKEQINVCKAFIFVTPKKDWMVIAEI